MACSTSFKDVISLFDVIGFAIIGDAGVRERERERGEMRHLFYDFLFIPPLS